MAGPHLGLRCWLCEDAAIHECSISCRHRYAYLAVYGRIGFCGDCLRLIGVQAVGERWWTRLMHGREEGGSRQQSSIPTSAGPAKERPPAIYEKAAAK